MKMARELLNRRPSSNSAISYKVLFCSLKMIRIVCVILYIALLISGVLYVYSVNF